MSVRFIFARPVQTNPFHLHEGSSIFADVQYCSPDRLATHGFAQYSPNVFRSRCPEGIPHLAAAVTGSLSFRLTFHSVLLVTGPDTFSELHSFGTHPPASTRSSPIGISLSSVTPFLQVLATVIERPAPQLRGEAGNAENHEWRPPVSFICRESE